MSTLTLKLIACAAMLCDHIGYFCVYFSPTLSNVLRIIGRLAFPIYCYLLAFGFRHSRSRGRYLLRLMAFAMLSELPFNYCFFGRVSFEVNNVYFTLALGLIALILYDALAQNRRPVVRFAAILAALACALVAEWLGTDYGGVGVLAICLFYAAGDSRLYRAVVCLLLGASRIIKQLLIALLSGFAAPEITGWDIVCLCAVAAVLPILLCNGQRGAYPKSKLGRLVTKYAFYAFYPAHLVILGVIMRSLVIPHVSGPTLLSLIHLFA